MKLFRRLVNVGDFKSFVAHPASTTRRPLDEAAFARVGVRPDMVRLSVGLEHIDNLLEHIDNLLEDIDQALGVTLSRGRLPPVVSCQWTSGAGGPAPREASGGSGSPHRRLELANQSVGLVGPWGI